MKKYFNPKLDIMEFSGEDILTFSVGGDDGERPVITDPNEVKPTPIPFI